MDAEIYSLGRDLIRLANKSWGEPTDGPIYPKGNLVWGNSPITAVCVGVWVFISKHEKMEAVSLTKVINCYIPEVKKAKVTLM